jgi:hypothetical protein
MAADHNTSQQAWVASALFILTMLMSLFWFLGSLYSDNLGLFFVILEFVFLIGFIWYINKTKIFVKLWEKRVYDTELVKERARLQAQKENKKRGE